MIGRVFALFLIVVLPTVAAAQERVTLATQRTLDNGALFLAAMRGYFKAEGLSLVMQAHPTAQGAVEALAAGTADFAVSGFSAAAFSLAGKGAIKAIAAQAREKRDYEGNELVASNAAYNKGLRDFPDLANKVIGIDRLGTSFHYQLGQIARIKRFDLAGVTLKPLQSYDAVAGAVRDGKVDAAILPAPYARALLVASQAKLIGWVSEVDESQLGALFASGRTLTQKPNTVIKVLRAYTRGAADYAVLLRHDRYGKQVSDARSLEAARAIARYVYPGSSGAEGIVAAGVYYMEPTARLDPADLVRQVEWYKAQGLIERTIDARKVIDLGVAAKN